MKNKITFILFFSFFHFLVFSQELPTIIPPSPEAASLVKFTEVPVSYYTGLPDINIPFYSIEMDGLTIPIGISYHARGIRVEEIASRIGIGWALNAGGTITRQVREKADEKPYEGYLTKNFYSNFGTNQLVRDQVYNDVINNLIDLVPDQFFFNFLGYSGKFVFDQRTKKPIIQSYSDLKIEQNELESWIITDEKGFKFYFDTYTNKDFTLNNFKFANELYDLPEEGDFRAINTWNLSKIVSPNGNQIEFIYELETPIFHRRSYDTDEKIGGSSILSSYFSKIRSEQYQLTKIVFNNGSIVFNKSPMEREDLIGSHRLEEIVVNDRNDQAVMKYKLYHSYSYNTSNASVLYYLYTMEPQARKRMFLDSISRINGIDENAFTYKMNYIDKNQLPNRFSNSQDIWGYYNGKNNGQFLTFSSYGSNIVNRQVDTLKSKIGLIESITYPTKGKTNYTFESNKAIPPSYFENLYFSYINPSESKNVGILKDIMFLNANGNYETTFTIGENKIGGITSMVSFTGDYGTCSTTQALSSCKYNIYIMGINGGTYSVPLFMGINTNIASFPPGDYKLVVDPKVYDDPLDFENGFAVYLSWQEQLFSEFELIYSGGNRIKKIEMNSEGHGKIIRTYEYLNEQGLSSGLVFSLPTYNIIKNQYYNLIELNSIAAKPGCPITYEQGNHVGYSRVTEFINSDNSSIGGKMVYTFTSMPDDGEFWDFPYTIPVDNEWLRGKPLKTEYYKSENSIFSLTEKTEYKYKYANQDFYQYITNPLLPADSLFYNYDKLQFRLPLIIFTNGDDPIESNNYKVYSVNGGVQQLYSKKRTSYLNPTPLVIEEINEYENLNHYQLTGQTTTSSKEEALESKYYYALDPEMFGQPGVDCLINKNMTGIPLKTETYRNGVKLSEQLTEYANDATTSNLCLPKYVYTKKGDTENPLEKKITYDLYDDKGNLQQYTLENGTSVSIIWGYNQTQPIAKIEGVAYGSLPTTYVTAAITTSNTGTEAALITALNNLRTNLPNAMVSTYTYKPLIGVTSITDPKGDTQYYIYDDFNRLQYVKDKDGNILSEHQYHYRPQ